MLVETWYVEIEMYYKLFCVYISYNKLNRE